MKTRQLHVETVGRAAKTFASAILLFFANTASGNAVPRTLTLSCRFEQPSLTVDSEGYNRVALVGCDQIASEGLPLLPFRTVRLVLPTGAAISGVSEQAPSTCELAGDWLMAFGHQPIPLGSTAAAGTASADTADPSVYASADAYPVARVELASLQRLAGYDIAFLRVYPLQYLPARRRLVFAPEVTVCVELSQQSVQPAALANRVLPSLRPQALQRVVAAVDNPESLADCQADATATRVPLSATTYDYLLVTSSALLPAFQPLVNRKQADGLTVIAQTMESVTNLYAGVDAAEKLRTFIRYAYTNWGVQYVLLGGDISIVPTRGVYARCAGVTLNQMPSDLYFACLDGSWNRDGDALWGEPTDGETGGDVDLLPEVRVGRAPVETAAEVTNFVARCLAAEVSPVPRFSACFAGEYLFNGGAQGGDALDALLTAFGDSFCPVSWLDDRPQQADVWSFTDALAALNRSPLLVAHFGHGSDSRYDTSVMRLISSDLDGLTNASPFLLYSTACNAGAFDNDQWGADCIGEELVKHGAHGAFAVVLNAREGWYDVTDESRYSGEFQKHFFNHLLSAHKNEIGAAHEQAKLDLLGSVETRGTSMPYRWCFFGLNLFGDPHAAIRVPLSLGFNMGPVTRTLTWNSWPGTAYAVYRATDLTEVLGTCIATNLVATPPLNIYIDNAPPVQRAFYRVRSL